MHRIFLGFGLILFASGCTLAPTKPQADLNASSTSSAAVIDIETEIEAPTPSAQTPASASVTETTAPDNGAEPGTGNDAEPGTDNSPTPEVISDSAIEVESDVGSAVPLENRPDPTAEPDKTLALAEITTQLGPICAPLTKATYQSQHLQFPDPDMTAYVKGQLHKVVDPDSPVRQADTPDYCYPDQRATPEHALVIQQGGTSTLIDMEPDPHGYVITTPVSFSADGRYLIAAVEVAYTGGDPGAYSIIFDLDRGDKLEMESYICTDADFDEYLGFTQPSEVAFRCSSYGGPDDWVEILDLETRSIYKPSIEPDSLEHYGTVTQPFQYTLQRP